MSWKKKKKQINRTKHKVTLIVGLMFAVVIGLVIFLCFRIFNNTSNNFKVESRVKQLEEAQKKNSKDYETIGWLRIQGTEVDLPIIYSEDTTADFPVELENYVWTKNISKEFSGHISILGHNIFNLSAHPKIKSNSFHRLEQLMAFVYYDFAKDNQYIQLTWDGKDYVYKIFAAGFVNTVDASFFNRYGTPTKETIKFEEEFVKKTSLYDYDVEVDENDSLISLSTCTRFYGSNSGLEFYVTGRLLRDGEKIEHYKVTKNSNYNEIEKKLKGDEENE